MKTMITQTNEDGAQETFNLSDIECQWFRDCENEAELLQDHPILGDVPICRRCADIVAKLSR